MGSDIFSAGKVGGATERVEPNLNEEFGFEEGHCHAPTYLSTFDMSIGGRDDDSNYLYAAGGFLSLLREPWREMNDRQKIETAEGQIEEAELAVKEGRVPDAIKSYESAAKNLSGMTSQLYKNGSRQVPNTLCTVHEALGDLYNQTERFELAFTSYSRAQFNADPNNALKYRTINLKRVLAGEPYFQAELDSKAAFLVKALEHGDIQLAGSLLKNIEGLLSNADEIKITVRADQHYSLRELATKLGESEDVDSLRVAENILRALRGGSSNDLAVRKIRNKRLDIEFANARMTGLQFLQNGQLEKAAAAFADAKSAATKLKDEGKIAEAQTLAEQSEWARVDAAAALRKGSFSAANLAEMEASVETPAEKSDATKVMEQYLEGATKRTRGIDGFEEAKAAATRAEEIAKAAKGFKASKFAMEKDMRPK